jgi:uncharacterized damage-inducible protein DinB
VSETTRGAAAAVRLVAANGAVESDVQRLPADLITWVPAPGVWSVMDILCHIREFIPFWTDEALRMVRRSDAQWGRDHTDAARLAAVADTRGYAIDEVLADIRRAARQAAEILLEFSDADLAVEATSVNPRWGRKPASFVVDHLLVQHVEKHLGQIRRNVTQFADARANAERA